MTFYSEVDSKPVQNISLYFLFLLTIKEVVKFKAVLEPKTKCFFAAVRYKNIIGSACDDLQFNFILYFG